MFEKIIQQIEKYDSIVIFGHINPDGDCYGSAVALKGVLSLKYPNKDIYITGSGLPFLFSNFIPMDKVSDEIIEKSLGIIVDANDLARLEDQRAYKCVAWAKIDHHIDTGSFKEGPQVVVENANSTCDIVLDLALELNVEIDKLTASALYLGILTDSGRFQFVNNYEKTFLSASYLCSKGADPIAINRLLSVVEEKTLKARGFVLSNYKKTENGVLYFSFNLEDLERLELKPGEMTGYVNLLSNVEDCPIWVGFVECPDHTGRVEFRSNGPALQPYALTMGGGGHLKACGAGFPEYNEKSIKKIIDDLDQIAKKWKEENHVGE